MVGTPPHLLGDGPRAFDAIVERADAAERSVEVRSFVWRDDVTGNRVGAALLRAAERGVHVLIHKDQSALAYEHTGGSGQSFFHKDLRPRQRATHAALRAAYGLPRGYPQRANPVAEALRVHPCVELRDDRRNFDHAKVYLFDDSSLVLGGMGIGDEWWREWVDVMVALDDPLHVARFRARMAGVAPFEAARGLDFLLHSRGLHTRRRSPLAPTRVRLIDSAQHRLCVAMAYLGDRRFTDSLVRAARRGVRVTLLTAARADLCGDLNRRILDRLVRRTGAPNLRIVLHPRMVHAKVVVVDGLVADVGSANFTPLSSGVYDEVNLFVRNAAFAAEVEAWLRARCQEGRVVHTGVQFTPWRAHAERAVVGWQGRVTGRRRRSGL
jgi:cardiolipin synthase A/B